MEPPKLAKFTDQPTYRPEIQPHELRCGQAGTSRRQRNELANAGGGVPKVRGKRGGDGVSGLRGGGAIMHHSIRGGQVQPPSFWSRMEGLGRLRKVELECGDEGEGDDVVSGKLWGVRLRRWNLDDGVVL